MTCIVQKYGGSSLKDLDCIKMIANRIKRTKLDGVDLAVVVSARMGLTDKLIEKAKAITTRPDKRELDKLLTIGEQESSALLAIALRSLGINAVSRTGAQVGIVTNAQHGRAVIARVTGGDLREQFALGNVVIVAGYQGVSESHHATTLGRGGSDLTAVSLAIALNADRCEIFTDVEGVYSADPRVIPGAIKYNEIDADTLLTFTSAGARVMQPRAVILAQQHGLNFEIKSSFNYESGTIVKAKMNLERANIRGVVIDRNQIKINIKGLSHKRGDCIKLWKGLAEECIPITTLLQIDDQLIFTVHKQDESGLLKVIEDMGLDKLHCLVSIHANVAQVSLIGLGIQSYNGVLTPLLDCLSRLDISNDLIHVSETKITVIVDTEKAELLAESLHEAFCIPQGETQIPETES